MKTLPAVAQRQQKASATLEVSNFREK